MSIEIEVATTTTTSSSYTFQSANAATSETERLDTIHSAITSYFGDRIIPSGLDGIKPRNILDLGSGSGAWAIAAATRFSEANVVAVDISPMPPRTIPRNLTFLQADLREPLDVGRSDFDLVHARLLMLHVPNVREIFQRIARLVNPGGWIMITELEEEEDAARGPSAHTQLTTLLYKMIRARGADPHIGQHLERMIQESGEFDSVNVWKVVLHLSRESEDPKEEALCRVWRASHIRVGNDLAQRCPELGFTPEVVEAYQKDLDDPSADVRNAMYFVWARRRLD